MDNISAGKYFSAALDLQGNIYTWGCGNNGRLGHGDFNSVSYPKKINFTQEGNSIKIMFIDCGDTHICAISTSKEIYSWGSGSFGKLGHGSFNDINVPTRVDLFKNSKIDIVVCGSYNTIGVTTEGRVYTWGKNNHGMLAQPLFIDSCLNMPTIINLNFDDISLLINNISLGTMHSMFLMNDGSIYVCGNYVNGILGIENLFDKLILPEKIPETFYINKQTDIKS